MLSDIKRRFRRAAVGAVCAAAGLSLLAAPGAHASSGTADSRPASDSAASYSAASYRAASYRAASYSAALSVDVSGKALGKINGHYIGLAFESSTLDSAVNKYNTVGDLPQLLRNLGTGVLRFGGDSADLASFTGTAPRVLRGLARLASATGWSVLYTENLGDFAAARVTADAQAVRAALGSSLFAFACGNEPDQFVAGGVRPPDYTVSKYLAQAADCLAAIRAGAPDAPLEGPDATNTTALTVPYAAKEAGTIAWFGQHYYPLGCAAPGDDPKAMAATLLSPWLAAQEAKRFRVYAATARRAGAPLLLTETNSACHGGVTGLSDTYAAALWVIDYLLSGAEHGVHEMNLQTGLNANCSGYSAFCQVGRFEYRPQPLYYGMLLAHMLGGGALLPVKVRKPAAANLAAFALKPVDGGLRLLVENLGTTQADVTLHIGGYRGEGSVLRLTAPKLLATGGIRIQGAKLAANGAFRPGKPGTAWCKPTGCAVHIPPYSAALIRFP